jgi:hypothetical protein
MKRSRLTRFASKYHFWERFPAQDGLDVLKHVRDGVFLFWATREHRNEQITPCPKKNTLEVGNANEAESLDGFSSLMTLDARSEP